MADRYVALYGSIDHADEEASLLEDEGIDVTVKQTTDLDQPDGSNLSDFSAVVAPVSLVFPNEEEARRAADFIRVGDITRPEGEMGIEGEQRLRA